MPAESDRGVYEPELRMPFEVIEPADLAAPLVCNSPHSGCRYPARFLAASRLDPFTLRRSEDAHVDELFLGAVAAGAPLLRAHFPRAYLDVNREPYELDPRMFEGRLPAFANTRSLRVAAGLGTIARLVGEAQEIYARRLTVEDAMGRIEHLYRPYHRALRTLVQRAEACFGFCVLIDCHSMPSVVHCGSSGREERTRADFVVGDRFGTSCASLIIDITEQHLRSLGYAVLRNKPYAGGFITEHYGNPTARRHALQIEVSRSLYMDEGTMQKNAGFRRLSADISSLMQTLAGLTAFDVGLDVGRAAAE